MSDDEPPRKVADMTFFGAKPAPVAIAVVNTRPPRHRGSIAQSQ